MPGVHAVFLDFGGVFCVPEHDQVMEALGTGAPVEAARLHRAHYAGMAALDRSRDGEDAAAWGTRYMMAYARAAGVAEGRLQVAVEALVAARLRWSQRLPGAVEALRELVRTGVALAIVSNSQGTLEARMRGLGICQVGAGDCPTVRAVVDSAVVGVRKPDPRIFDVALRAAGAAREATVHVGDSVYYDLDGARAAGIRGLHLDPYRFCRDRGHEHIAALADVIPLVKSSRVVESSYPDAGAP